MIPESQPITHLERSTTTDPTGHFPSTSPGLSQLSRRSVTGLAWTVPVVALAAATPAAAASQPLVADAWEVIGPLEFDTTAGATFELRARTYNSATGTGVDGEAVTFYSSTPDLILTTDGQNYNYAITAISANGGYAVVTAEVSPDATAGSVLEAVVERQDGGAFYTITVT